jgi:hypothetical protein
MSGRPKNKSVANAGGSGHIVGYGYKATRDAAMAALAKSSLLPAVGIGQFEGALYAI